MSAEELNSVSVARIRDVICPVCDLNIEDVIHSLFNCPKYELFFSKIDNGVQKVESAKRKS